MGWRFRRSTSFGPFRFTFSKRGTGVSVGVPGARIGIGADGRVRETVGIPGTGISHQRTFGSRAGVTPKVAHALPYFPGRPPSAQPISIALGCSAAAVLFVVCAVLAGEIAPRGWHGMPIVTVLLLALPFVLRAWSSWRARGKDEATFAAYLQGMVDRFGEDNARLMVRGDPWQGATQEMVRVMYGAPDDVSTDVHKQRASEVWKYVPLAKNRYALRVEFENGVCVGWQTA